VAPAGSAGWAELVVLVAPVAAAEWVAWAETIGRTTPRIVAEHRMGIGLPQTGLGVVPGVIP
jgi:hypothetical protein